MPRRNQEKDKRTVYIAHRYGFDKNGNEIYGNPIEQRAVVSLYSGNSEDDRFGTDHNYSFRILFDVNSETKYINLNTRIWLNTTPINSTDKPDCEISKEPEFADGQVLVSCNSTSVNETEFFYEYEGRVLSFVAKDDLENNRFFTNANVYLPIDNETKMWYLEPADIYDDYGTMTLINKTERYNIIEYEVELDG